MGYREGVENETIISVFSILIILKKKNKRIYFLGEERFIGGFGHRRLLRLRVFG